MFLPQFSQANKFLFEKIEAKHTQFYKNYRFIHPEYTLHFRPSIQESPIAQHSTDTMLQPLLGL